MPSIRELMIELNYKSPRSVSILIEKLVKKKYLRKKVDGGLIFIRDTYSFNRASTISVPILGHIACGPPFFATENIEGYIPVSTGLINQNSKYFILKAHGNSMNLAGIDNGDWVLIKQQRTAENGEYVVALLDDQATIKKLQKTNKVIILKPVSTNPNHKPIILEREFLIQGVVVCVIPNTDK